MIHYSKLIVVHVNLCIDFHDQFLLRCLINSKIDLAESSLRYLFLYDILIVNCELIIVFGVLLNLIDFILFHRGDRTSPIWLLLLYLMPFFWAFLVLIFLGLLLTNLFGWGLFVRFLLFLFSFLVAFLFLFRFFFFI